MEALCLHSPAPAALGRSCRPHRMCQFPQLARVKHINELSLLKICRISTLSNSKNLFSGRNGAQVLLTKVALFRIWAPSSWLNLHLSQRICTTAAHRAIGQCLSFGDSQHFCAGLMPERIFPFPSLVKIPTYVL